MPRSSKVLRTAWLLVMCSLEICPSRSIWCWRALKMVISVAKSLTLSKIGQWAAFGHFPLRFHGLGAFAKQGVVAFAADEREVLVAASLFVDDL